MPSSPETTPIQFERFPIPPDEALALADFYDRSYDSEICKRNNTPRIYTPTAMTSGLVRLIVSDRSLTFPIRSLIRRNHQIWVSHLNLFAELGLLPNPDAVYIFPPDIQSRRTLDQFGKEIVATEKFYNPFWLAYIVGMPKVTARDFFVALQDRIDWEVFDDYRADRSARAVEYDKMFECFLEFLPEDKVGFFSDGYLPVVGALIGLDTDISLGSRMEKRLLHFLQTRGIIQVFQPSFDERLVKLLYETDPANATPVIELIAQATNLDVDEIPERSTKAVAQTLGLPLMRLLLYHFSPDNAQDTQNKRNNKPRPARPLRVFTHRGETPDDLVRVKPADIPEQKVADGLSD